MELRDYLMVGGFIITVGSMLIAIGGLVYSLKRVIHDVETIETDMTKLHDDITSHIGDTKSHVNHLYMLALENSIKDVKEGQKETNHKLDRIIEKLIDNPSMKRAD